MADQKTLFYDGMTNDSDRDDDDLDNFADFRNRGSQTGIHSQNLGLVEDNELPQICSQSTNIISSQDADDTPLPANLKDNYISTSDQLNTRLRLHKKDFIRAKSAKLAGCTLLYWPIIALEIQNGKKGRKVRKGRTGACMGAVENGAQIALKWDGGRRTTHIVVDRHFDLGYQGVLKSLELSSIPSNIQLVKSGWVDAMISSSYREKEDRHRLLGHPTSLTSSNKPAIMSKKRPANETNSISSQVGFLADRTISVPALKKSKIEEAPSPTSEQSLFHSDQRPTPRPPELMNQHHTSSRAHHAAIIAVNMERAGLLPKSYGDELDQTIAGQVEEVRKSAANRQIPSQMSESSHPVTDNGEKIDRLMQQSEQDEDQLSDVVGNEDSASRFSPQSHPVDYRTKNFLCANKNLEGTAETGPNAELIEQLKVLASHYGNKSEDAFRAKGYREAISVLRKQKHKITTREQALSLKRIGPSIATKIGQFEKQGKIGLIETFANDPRQQAIQLFTGIYGVGQRSAETWYNQGLRTLEDLRTKIDLHEFQRIGLDHYDDFKSRIPREEVSSHVEYVTNVAREISRHLEVVVGGSYRRGQSDSGDIDFLITAPDSIVSTTQLQKLVFEQLIPTLRDKGYIKADLTIPTENKDSSKWLGAACLPNTNPAVWRRVDILLVPNAEWGAALIYFTGNDIFNRSIRLLARRQGGTLNQRGFFKGVVRDKHGVKIVPGYLVESRDEKKIFEALGVKWRPPHERCP